MLTALRIADFAILQAAELAFGPGLTAITGETGAGKTILLDALGAVLGGRASEKMVRHGCDAAEVEALFEGPLPSAVMAVLEEFGAPGEDTLVLRRVIGKQGGRNRCYVNGRLATVQLLRQIAGPLVDVSAQHAQHRLLDPAAHLELLDRYAGALDLRAAVGRAHATWRATATELDELRKRVAQAADRLDWLRFVHKELSELQPRDGELAEITGQIQKMRAAEQLGRAVHEALRALGGEGGIREQAAKAARNLGKWAHLDDKLNDFMARLQEVETLAGDLDFELGGHARTLRRDDRELSRLSERQDLLTRALRKHGGSEAAMVARLAQVSAELDAEGAQWRIHELERSAAAQAAELAARAEKLSDRRSLVADPLCRDIGEVLQQLGMAAAQVRFALTRAPDAPGPTGIDSAHLYFRANRGEAEGLLHQVASGGELSRVLLAIQRALGAAASAPAQATGPTAPGLEPLPTAVFDEADAGLSGATGLVLGRFMADVAARQQVIVISHLPQVAAAADAHVQVSKREDAGRTRSELRHLAPGDRETELARMLGATAGQAETALAHARELLRVQRRPAEA
ncbi:MAG: DNA repair protein RecN [Deltaproteobacteria bacterium]|nr:DNA repair protein RecN [Deltaproteobacteria bacterium]